MCESYTLSDLRLEAARTVAGQSHLIPTSPFHRGHPFVGLPSRVGMREREYASALPERVNQATFKVLAGSDTIS